MTRETSWAPPDCPKLGGQLCLRARIILKPGGRRLVCGRASSRAAAVSAMGYAIGESIGASTVRVRAILCDLPRAISRASSSELVRSQMILTFTSPSARSSRSLTSSAMYLGHGIG